MQEPSVQNETCRWLPAADGLKAKHIRPGAAHQYDSMPHPWLRHWRQTAVCQALANHASQTNDSGRLVRTANCRVNEPAAAPHDVDSSHTRRAR